MPEPITVGAFVVGVLAKVAEAGLGEFAKSAAKDAYEALKQKVRGWAGAKIEILEAAPDSGRVRREIADTIDNQAEHDQQEVKSLAQDVISKETAGGSRTIGLDFSDLRNVQVVVKNVTAKGNATGASFQRIEGGKIAIDQATAEGDHLK